MILSYCHMAACAAVIASLLAPAKALAGDPLSCLLLPTRASDLGSDQAGIVSEVTVRRADLVVTGDVLVRIDTMAARTNLDVAEATAASLGTRLERARRLQSSSLVSRDEVEALEAELAAARADRARAELAIARSEIRAPFGGYIADVFIEQGELIGPEPLLRLIEVDRLRAELVFVAEEWNRAALGDVFTIEADIVGRRAEGRVVAIDRFIDASSNTFSVLVEIPNGDLGMPAGASCRVVP
jgi:membrane fusion protein (multidrug efflux system)